MDETKYKSGAWALIQSTTNRYNRIFITDDVTMLYRKTTSNGNVILTSKATSNAVLRITMDEDFNVKMTILEEGLEMIVDGEQSVTYATHLCGEHSFTIDGNRKFMFFYLRPDGTNAAFEGYKVVCEIERGSFGSRHFKCVNLSNNALCDIKRKRQEDEDSMRCENSLAQEYKILQRLRHPNVVEIRGFSRIHSFVELDYFPGSDLERRVQGHGKLLDERDIKIVHYQLALAIEYLHKNDVVHCDVRPSNVMLVDKMGSCAVKLAGFESCTNTQNKGNPRNKVIRLTPYSAPEIFESYNAKFDVTKAIDVWGFAVTLYYVITEGSFPFGETLNGVEYAERVRKFKVDFDSEIIRNYDKQAVSLLMLVLTTDAERRISASEVVNAPYFRKDSELKNYYNYLNSKG